MRLFLKIFSIRFFYTLLIFSISYAYIYSQQSPPETNNLQSSKLFPKSEMPGVFDTIKKEPLTTQKLLDSLESKAEKRSWTDKLYEAIIRNPGINPIDTITQTIYETPYMRYENYVITNINIIRMDPFGTDIYSPTDSSSQNKIHKKLGNTIHFKTFKRVIANHLLFKNGDLLNPYLIAENERLLRSVNYIEDAKINLININDSLQTVNIEVITKDEWPIGLGWEGTDIGKGNIDFFNRNIFGMGHENKNTIYYDDNLFPRFGYKGYYRVKNLGGSFIDSKIEYTNNFGTNTWLLNLERNFFTSSLKYAGGATIEKNKTKTELELEDTTLINDPLNYLKYDIWLGRAFPINFRKKDNSFNLFLSARAYQEDFSERTDLVRYNKLYQFQNKLVVLGRVGLSKQNFSKSNLIYSFGRTEDIPYGVIASATFGYEVNEYSQRPYLGTRLAYGSFLPFKGYGYIGSEIGTFGGHQQPQQVSYRLESRYFSRLLKSGAFRFRLFMNMEYVNGLYRFSDELIHIKNKSGILGLKSSDLEGRQKLVVSAECITFTPVHFYGFRLATFNYVNIGLIGNNRTSIFDAPVYSGIGIGFRLRNEHLVFPTIQFRLSYYPKIPNDPYINYAEFSGETKLKFQNFYPTKPSIVEYR